MIKKGKYFIIKNDRSEEQKKTNERFIPKYTI